MQRSRKSSIKSTKGKRRKYGGSARPRLSLKDSSGVQLRVRRMAQDGILSSPTSGEFVINNLDTGAPPPWFKAFSTVIADPYASSLCYAFGMGTSFQLTDVPNSAEFTGLFNEYRIDKVVIRISPVSSGSFDETAASQASCYMCWDPNDGTPPATSAIMQERDTATLVDFSSGKEVFLSGTPRPAQQIYTVGQATSYGYADNKALWLDCTSPSDSTPHYGAKFYFRNFVSFLNSGYALRFQPTYYLSLRRTR